jgi:hypothetical protein
MPTPEPVDPGERRLLRHCLATLAYRAEKVLRDPPADFAGHRTGDLRTPLELIGHLGDLIEWATTFAAGDPAWKAASTGVWQADVERFWRAMARLDELLGGDAPLRNPAAQMFQGPIADALTHVGQLAMLRRLHGAPIRPESYAKADIGPGRVGPEQAPPRREFDGDASLKR